MRTHQPEVRRSCGPGPGRGAVGCSAKAAAPEAGVGRGPRGGHSLALTPGPAPRGRGRRPGLLSLTAPGGGDWDSEVSAVQKLLTIRRCLPRPSRPRSGLRPAAGLEALPRLLRPRRPRALRCVWASRWRLAWRAGPAASSLLSPAFSFSVPSSHLLACQTACCLLARGPDPQSPSLPCGASDF